MTKYKTVVIVRYSKKAMMSALDHTLNKMTKKGYEFVQMSGSPLESIVLLFKEVEVIKDNKGPTKEELREAKLAAKEEARERKLEDKRIRKEAKRKKALEKKAINIEKAKKKIKNHIEIDEVQQD